VSLKARQRLYLPLCARWERNVDWRRKGRRLRSTETPIPLAKLSRHLSVTTKVLHL
jgi:hypothetical protein